MLHCVTYWELCIVSRWPSLPNWVGFTFPQLAQIDLSCVDVPLNTKQTKSMLRARDKKWIWTHDVSPVGCLGVCGVLHNTFDCTELSYGNNYILIYSSIVDCFARVNALCSVDLVPTMTASGRYWLVTCNMLLRCPNFRTVNMCRIVRGIAILSTSNVLFLFEINIRLVCTFQGRRRVRSCVYWYVSLSSLMNVRRDRCTCYNWQYLLL